MRHEKEENYKQNYSIEPSRSYFSKNPGGKIEPSSFNSNLKSNAIYFYWYVYKKSLESDEILNKLKLPEFYTIKFNSETNLKEPKEKALEKVEEWVLNTDNTKLSELQKLLKNIDLKKNGIINEIKGKTIAIKDLTEEDLKYIEEVFQLIKFDIVSENVNFYNFSTGQKIMISYFGILVKNYLNCLRKECKNKKAVVMIDEVETSFHPQWQKDFLYYLLKFIEELKLNDFYSHLILVTHSPFIISDLPKENIIFLDKDENGKCKVVDGLKEKKETFGANIHTLLSDSFFMEDGFIGKFAESKINEVINYLNNKKSKINTDEEAQKIINIIGEPIIKKELQRMLDSKRLKKVNNIDEKIKQLEYELEILKKHQSQNIKNELLDRGKREYFTKKKDGKNNNN